MAKSEFPRFADVASHILVLTLPIHASGRKTISSWDVGEANYATLSRGVVC
jgi:hypothetical protein